MADTEIIQVGTPAPDFSLPSVAGAAVRLSDFRGQQNVVLFFMRDFRWLQCREFARQLAVASPEFQAHHAVSLIVGPGNSTQAERLVETLKADPMHVLYDEKRAVYEVYSLERVFLSLIQQSAVFVIDGQGTVRVALVASNPQSWLNPQRIKQVNDLLDELNPGGR